MRTKTVRTNIVDENQGGMIQLGNEDSQSQFCCTRLPRHWRSNKSLAAQFKVIAYDHIPDTTRCSLIAGNDENHSAQLKNHVAYFHNNVAEFNDLRFVGKSGRGKLFNVTITIWTDPVQVLVYRHAIKVTADGPRPPRPKSGLSHGQDQTNSSDSSTEGDSHDQNSMLSGVMKKQRSKSKSQICHPVELEKLGLGSAIVNSGYVVNGNVNNKSNYFEQNNRPSSCHSNSSSLMTTTASMHSLASSAGTPQLTTPLQCLLFAAASHLMQQNLLQTQPLQAVPTAQSASYGHKPWLKHHEKPIWRPFVEDSH